MTDFASTDFMRPRVITSQSRWTSWRELVSVGVAGNPSSASWPTANLAILIPLTLPFAYPVKRVWWANGTPSSGSAHVDFGIYTLDGTRLYSTGSTLQSATAKSVQYTSADFILSPGRYYMAIAMDGTGASSQIMRNGAASALNLRVAGLLQESAAFPLPASIAGGWAAVTNAFLPFCGITLDTTGF